jgi:signal peptidase I
VPAVLRSLPRALAWLVVIAAGLVLAVAVVVPRLTGATPYTVLTGSMTPSYPPGTLVVVRPTPVEQIAVGDVVTYQLSSGDPTVVTHRVVSTGTDTVTGQTFLRTQGDANASPDTAPVAPVQVRGTVWYAVPYVGKVTTLLTGHDRQLAVDVVAGLLLVYAAVVLGRRRRMPVELDAPVTPAAPSAPPVPARLRTAPRHRALA